MRIGAFRIWFSNAVQQGAATAKRVGTMIGRKIRAATGAIDAGVGVGDDESGFGGGRSRAWFQEIVEETKKRLLNIFEKSFFERFPGFQKRMRRLLGGATVVLPKPKALPKGPVKLGAHTQASSEEAAAFRRRIQQEMMNAHTREHAGLREEMDRRKGRRGRDAEPEEEEADHS